MQMVFGPIVLQTFLVAEMENLYNIRLENPVLSYTSESDGYNLVNTYVHETIDITGIKVWEDGNNQDGIRPEKITVHLLKDGEVIDSKDVTANENWSWSFTGLDKYENRTEIVYTVTEEPVEGYELAEITRNDEGVHTITNRYTPEVAEIPVQKIWEDSNNQDGIRPESLTVQLWADGVETEKQVVLNQDNSWSGSFTDLPVFDNGQRIIYTVTEELVEGYTSVVSGSMEAGFVFTNIHIPEEPTEPSITTRPTEESPVTGERSSAPLIAIMTLCKSTILYVLRK